MEDKIILEKTYYVHLKENGEVCNRLPAGTQVHSIKRKGDWLRITWRSGKKKGWIQRP
jgi:hypothetical protein